MNTIRMIAYRAETSVANLLAPNDRALKALELAVRVNPTYKEGFLLTAEILHKYMNDSAAAIANYKCFISLGGAISVIPKELRSKVQ
jgi:hypothetical protein